VFRNGLIAIQKFIDINMRKPIHICLALIRMCGVLDLPNLMLFGPTTALIPVLRPASLWSNFGMRLEDLERGILWIIKIDVQPMRSGLKMVCAKPQNIDPRRFDGGNDPPTGQGFRGHAPKGLRSPSWVKAQKNGPTEVKPFLG
jgi:hypothetical protein